MAGKDFRINPEALEEVASKVEQLLNDLNGGSGFVAGNKPDFAEATSTHVKDALGELSGDGDGTTAFAGSYDWEFKNMNVTYDNMIKQLTALHTTISNTAQLHKQGDDDSQAAARAAGGEV